MTRFIALKKRYWSTRQARLVTIGATASVLTLFGLSLQLAPTSSAGFTANVKNATNTAATAAYFTCTGAVTADAPSARFAYKLNEPTNSTVAADFSPAKNPGSYQGAMTSAATAPLACPRDAGGAYVLNGSTSFIAIPALVTSPATFSLEVWFKTTTPSGKLIGFGNQQTSSSVVFDRQIYLSTTGQLIFGTYNFGTQVITSPATYTDGKWHQTVATFSAGTGMTLYVDGNRVATNATYASAETNVGYWRIGYDNLSGWPNTGTNYFFTGSMRYAAVYTTTLTATQVSRHYTAGR